MKVLIVEDDRLYAKQIALYLKERVGIESEIVRSYEELKALPSLEPYRYILVDIFLRDCQECEIVEEIIQTNKPLIIITSCEDFSLFEKYNRKRVIDYVIKHDMVRLEYLVFKFKILNFLEKYAVLLVEDSRSYRRYLYNFFKLYYPYANVMLAGNKQEALELLEANDDFIKLVITDYSLMDSTGLELVKEIRQNYLFDDVAIIALTALDINHMMARFLKSGANDFLHKGFSNFEFVCRIDNVVKSLIQFEEIKNYSNKDYLTQCYNRRYLYDAGVKMYYSLQRAQKRVSIAIFDLDHFKKLNDTYGHLVGDMVLKDFAQILQKSIRGSDFVVRYGGEEFLMFLGSCDRFEAKEIVEQRIRKEVTQRVIQLEEGDVTYNFSCGICDSGDSFEELIKGADKKLYEAKKSRGVTVV